VFLLGAVSIHARSDFRQGGEFQVNQYTTNSQVLPSIAVDSDGDFVVTWIGADQDLSSHGVFAARFNSTGAALNGEFQVNAHSALNTPAAVASESDGDFVIVWTSLGQDGSGQGVFGRRYTSAGASLATEFQVNTYTPSQQRYASIGSDADGDFVVVWESLAEGIFGRRFDSAGTPQATEFLVNSRTASFEQRPAVALESDGDFVVVWTSGDGSDGGYASRGIFARRFSSAGVPLGDDRQINTYTTDSQYRAKVTAEADGDFVVAWQSRLQDGDFFGIFLRRFSSAGVARGVEFQVNVYTTGSQSYPKIAADDSGDFVVTWLSEEQDGSGMGVFARRFSSSGSRIGGEFQVNTFTFGYQTFAGIDCDSDGDFVIAWGSPGQDGEAGGIFAQRFSIWATLDVDGDGGIGALTDGVLILRDHFGFTGASLIAGAVGPDCTRCEADDITAYLTGLGLVLDIDDNGVLDALTDGVLVLRFTFGLTGAALVNGAVAGNCVTRCDAATILAYLQTLD
jgi:hypothetical protein